MKNKKCSTCSGTGKIMEECTTCSGNGWFPWKEEKHTIDCPTCKGAKEVPVTCPECGGTGEIEKNSD